VTSRFEREIADWRDDFRVASRLLTRVPLSFVAGTLPESMPRAMRAFPLVGACVGLAGAGGAYLADALRLPTLASALIAVAATALLTGALHEDGLADTADGLGGGATRERKLEIMRDSRSGVYGVLALVLSVALRAAAIAALLPAGHLLGALVASHAVSRGVLPALIYALEPARSDGLGAAVGRPDEPAVLWSLGIAAALALLGLGLGGGLVALAATSLAVAGVAALARRQIGGYTGDVLGAAQQIGEIVMLLSAAAS
jgi:adenosylcobinamide-GDP ribazoletransferase